MTQYVSTPSLPRPSFSWTPLEWAWVFTLMAFVMLNLFPARALAFAEIAESSHLPFSFAVPYGQLHTSLFSGSQLTSPSQLKLRPGLLLSVWASAYTSTVAQTDADPFTTASGTTVHPGTVAANFLPLGTAVSMNGTQYTVEDRLNSRYDDQYIIDVWMASEDDALHFGIRTVTIEIVSLP